MKAVRQSRSARGHCIFVDAYFLRAAAFVIREQTRSIYMCCMMDNSLENVKVVFDSLKTVEWSSRPGVTSSPPR